VRLGELASGAVVEEQQVFRNLDTIKVQLLPGDAALDQEFEYTDCSDQEAGDYYYVRVRQVDGSMAWSSPWWVGGGAER